MSGDIPGDAESTRNYGQQAALLARGNAAPLSPVPPPLPLLGGGTQETETARSREEASQMQRRPARFPATAAFHVQRGSSPASQGQCSCCVFVTAAPSQGSAGEPLAGEL